MTGQNSFRMFAAKHLNVEVGLALRSDAWAGADYWQEQSDPDLTLEALIERSEVITVGIDGGGLDDLMALAVLGRDVTTRDWLLWDQDLGPSDRARTAQERGAAALDFATAGELVVVDRIGQDVEEIAELCSLIGCNRKTRPSRSGSDGHWCGDRCFG